jgi:DNA repair photolyase
VPRKGRGATFNVAHRFERTQREVDGDALDAARFHDDVDAHPPLKTEVRFEHARSILSWNDSPDIGFDRAINPYRGCEHGCIYCYARPTHSYLNLSPGLDFETLLVAKTNAAELLRKELAATGYRPDTVNLGSATDAYQPIERDLLLTRQVIDVLAQCHHPLVIVTKSSLVERDLDLLGPMAGRQLATVHVTLTTLEHDLSRILEPRAASPARRLRTVEALARAGVPVSVNVAPVIPFINEPELERLLEAAAAAGADAAFYTVLRLPWEVNPLFQQWLAMHFPQRAERVMNRLREMRGGKDDDADFGTRMTGEGVWSQLIHDRFVKACVRLGLAMNCGVLRSDLFVPPASDARQIRLF